MEVDLIQKYAKYSVPELIKIATKHFNQYIRNRDAGDVCISCRKYKPLQAGHYYSAGHYSALRFNENNVHGQCIRCNMFLSGNLNEYRKNLIHKIGVEEVEKLDNTPRYYKWDRFSLIDIIERYKLKNKDINK